MFQLWSHKEVTHIKQSDPGCVFSEPSHSVDSHRVPWLTLLHIQEIQTRRTRQRGCLFTQLFGGRLYAARPHWKLKGGLLSLIGNMLHSFQHNVILVWRWLFFRNKKRESTWFLLTILWWWTRQTYRTHVCTVRRGSERYHSAQGMNVFLSRTNGILI